MIQNSVQKSLKKELKIKLLKATFCDEVTTPKRRFSPEQTKYKFEWRTHQFRNREELSHDIKNNVVTSIYEMLGLEVKTRMDGDRLVVINSQLGIIVELKTFHNGNVGPRGNINFIRITITIPKKFRHQIRQMVREDKLNQLRIF